MVDDKLPIILAAAGGLLLLSSRKPLGVYPPLPPYTENRVKVAEYGRLPTSSPLLVNVPSSGSQQRLHVLAAKRFDALRAAAAREGFPGVRIASGWRPHLWRSRQHYEDTLIKQYGSVQAGRRIRAYNSPHETGLAMDFGTHGLAPVSATNAQQFQTPFFKWLQGNAHRFGISPYKGEAWHWEVKVPREAWETGQEFTEDFSAHV